MIYLGNDPVGISVMPGSYTDLENDVAELKTDVSGKADRVTNAVESNFAALDAIGNLKDSGHKHTDYLTAHQDISGKADRVPSAAENNFAALDANGNLKDSGHKHTDYLTAHQDISGKADKAPSPTAGDFAALDSSGSLVDSGHRHSDYLPAGTIDDTAGPGDTDKVWSADRTSSAFAMKLDASMIVFSATEPPNPVEGMIWLKPGAVS